MFFIVGAVHGGLADGRKAFVARHDGGWIGCGFHIVSSPFIILQSCLQFRPEVDKTARRNDL